MARIRTVLGCWCGVALAGLMASACGGTDAAADAAAVDHAPPDVGAADPDVSDADAGSSAETSDAVSGPAACPVDPMDALYPGPDPPDPLAPFPPADACVARPHDAIIVLGCPTRDDGTAADCQVARADIAVRLADAGFADRFITTGGAVQNAWIEADTLAELLVARGVPEARIQREPEAEHTDENLYFSARIMQGQGWQDAWVVSDSTGHLLYSAVCDANCCVDLGRLTLVSLPLVGPGGAEVAQPVGHYALFPVAEPIAAAECAHIEGAKMMCTNLPDRRACKDDFQL